MVRAQSISYRPFGRPIWPAHLASSRRSEPQLGHNGKWTLLLYGHMGHNIHHLISNWDGQIITRIYIYIYIYILRNTEKYAYIIVYDCWQKVYIWYITWIIIIPNTNLSVPRPFMTASYHNIPYHLAGPFGLLSWECCPTLVARVTTSLREWAKWASTGAGSYGPAK